MQFLKPGFVQIAFGGGGEGGGGGGGRDGGMSIMKDFKEAFDKAAMSVKEAFTTGPRDYQGPTQSGAIGYQQDPRTVGVDKDTGFLTGAGEGSGGANGRGEDRPAPAQAAAAPAPAAAPAQAATPAPAMTSAAEQETQIAEAGETAAEKQRRLGLAQTIATSPAGLLAGGEGTTRRRRSLMGGGMIA